MPTVKLLGTDTPGTINFPSGYVLATQYTCDATGIDSEIRLHCLVNSNVRAAIYSDNGSNQAGNLLAESNSVAITAGDWRTVALNSNVNVTAGTKYWLAVQCQTTGGVSYRDVTWQRGYKAQAYGAFPATGSGWTYDSALDCGIQGYGTATPPAQTIYPSSIIQAIAYGTPTLTLIFVIKPVSIVQPIAVGTPTLAKRATVSPDYPDWTESMQLTGTEIFLPVNIQGVSVTIPVDITAGTIGTISVDIVAQTVGNVSVNIAAQAANINVNIAASAVTFNVAIQSSAVTINMDIKAQSVGVYLQPEWAARSGVDKDFQGEADFAAGAANTYTVYTVPTGKAFLVNQVGLIDLLNTSNQTFAPPLSLSLAAFNGSTYAWKAGASGAGGGVSNLVKPAYFAAGLEVRVRLANPSSIPARLCYFISGYEISV